MFTLLIIGADANAYYMARCYHELTNRKAYLLAKSPIWFTDISKIVIPKYNFDLREENELLKELDKFYKEHKSEKILLVSSSENYIEIISKNKDIYLVEDEKFSVDLVFGGIPYTLVIPFSSIIYFADPHAKFGLSFEIPDHSSRLEDMEIKQEKKQNDKPAEVISIDSFRKKQWKNFLY